MGRLGFPLLAAMAVSPYLGGLAFQRGGAEWTLLLLTVLALANVILVGALRLVTRRISLGLGCVKTWRRLSAVE
jgi:hypothetical protein